MTCKDGCFMHYYETCPSNKDDGKWKLTKEASHIQADDIDAWE